MEKNEKIQQKQTQVVRTVLAAAFVISCVLLLWGLLSMDDPTSSSIEGLQNFRKNPLLAPVIQKQQEDDDKGEEEEEEEEESVDQEKEEHDLEARVKMLDKEVRDIKANLPKGSFMEVDEKGVAASRRLQDATRLLLSARYGPSEPYRVKVGLKFQPSNPTTATRGEYDSFVIELAPSRLQPHSIFTFLEVARHWPEKKGAFHRRANHVLQVMVGGHQVPHLAFQEYSKEYPHKKGTVGYAGRPSGPAWYVSIMNNSENHGPGSQQHENPYEADSCFGTVVEGFENVVVERITKMPGSGFLIPPSHVLIETMTIMVPSADGTYAEWQPHPWLAKG